jgi:nucleoside-diphosphate-sugar epimerase
MAENILITGASGMIGPPLTTALLEQNPSTRVTITDVATPSIPTSAQKYSDRITTVKTDLTDVNACAELLEPPFTTCYFMHGIMSAGSEQDLDLGLRVNVDSHRNVLDILRKRHAGKTKVVFTSSLAAYGPTEPGEVISENTAPKPQGSYGTEKAMIELLVNDFSRRGLIDGRVVRLPTVIVRPGKPSAAASSFASGIVRYFVSFSAVHDNG